MQSGSGTGRSPSAAPPPPGRSSSSASASPSSSSSASHLGFESIHHHHHQQQQQHQQLALRQSLHQQQQQQQQLRKAEGEENILPYKVVGIHGVLGGSNFPSSPGALSTSQPLRKFNDLPHQHGAQPREENQNKGQGLTRQPQNPVHQAYLQFALQNAQQQKSHGDLLVQQQGRFSIVGPAGRDQDMRVNNLKMQDLMSLQSANQAQASTFKKSEEHFGHGEKQMRQGHTSSDQRNELKAPQTAIGQLTPTNIIRPGQSAQSQASMENLANNQLLMAQLQAMQAWAMEHNVDLSLPANANLIAQVLPIWQSSRLAAIQKPNEASTAGQQSCFSSSKQQAMSSPDRSLKEFP